MSKRLFCGFCGKPYLYGEPRGCNCRANANDSRKAKKRKPIASRSKERL